MLLTFPPRTDWIYDCVGGEFITEPEMLHDRKPGEPVLLEWAAGEQTLTTTTVITATRSAAFVPRLAVLLGSNLPAGLRVELHGRRPEDAGYDYGLGGNSATQRLVRLWGGSVGAWWALSDGLDPITGYGLTLYNDADGSLALDASEEFELGQLIVVDALHIPHEVGPVIRYVKGGSSRRTQTQQASRVDGTGFRRLSMRGVHEHVDQAWGGGIDGSDWDRLAEALCADPFCCVALYHADATELQRVALYGEIDGLGIAGGEGPYKQLEQMSLDEIPS
jgi:hypothetical protein